MPDRPSIEPDDRSLDETDGLLYWLDAVHSDSELASRLDAPDRGTVGSLNDAEFDRWLESALLTAQSGSALEDLIVRVLECRRVADHNRPGSHDDPCNGE